MLGRNGDAVGVLLALIGKVEYKVGARSAPIVVGDFLTTLTTPGHAMKVADRSRVFGSIVGKAVQSHAEGRGLFAVLHDAVSEK
jgi:hypothetical protein